MDELIAVDERSLTATLAPGLRLPEADRALAAHGLTLAHLPQSYEWATVGGCVATRSAGQASTGHGRIDENLVAVRVATPLGELATRDAPASAAGPELRQLVAGSEGVLGVITAATLRVHRLPEEQRFEGWLAAGLRGRLRGPAAARAGRRGARRGPAVGRGRDPLHARARRRRRRSCGARVGDRCLMILGWDDPSRRREAVRILRDAGARFAARKPGERWAHSRFDGPHLRDDLLDRGVMVETLETATTWSNLAALHAAVRAALPGLLVGCHVSHLYPTGASLYFTVLGRRERRPGGSVARAQGGGHRRDRRPPAARSPTTTRSAATTRRGWAPRWGSWGWACCGRSRTAATRPGS